MGRPSQVLVRTLSIFISKDFFLFFYFYQHFLDDLIDKIVFLIDNLLFIATVQNIRTVNRTLFQNFLVGSSNLMAYQRGFLSEDTLSRSTSKLVDLILDFIAVHHCVF